MSINKVLIADDEPDYTEIIGAVAEDIGFTTSIVHMGSEVLERVCEDKPSLIILDLRMPGIDGLDVLEQLADIKCTAPIILISGLGQETLDAVEDIGRQKALNIAGSLSKPMSPDQIEQALFPHLSPGNGITH